MSQKLYKNSFYIPLDLGSDITSELCRENFRKICNSEFLNTFDTIQELKFEINISLLKSSGLNSRISQHLYLTSHDKDLLQIIIFTTDTNRDYIQAIYDEFCLFSIACNIAHPCCINIKNKPIFFLDDEPWAWGHELNHEIWDCIEDKEEPLVDKIQNLDILQTWNWSSSLTGFKKGKLTNTNVGNALCALSSFFTLSDQFYYPEYFLWSAIGIEALYADGTQSVQYQIKEKAKIILDLNETELKTINKFYNFRSRFFHGQINLYNRHFHGDHETRFPKELLDAENEHTYYARFGARLLLTSLQYCAKHNIRSLDFKYRLI